MGDPPATSGASSRRGFGRVIGRVAPSVIRQIDLDEVVDQIDVNAIAAQLDLDALLERIDVDLLISRLDVNAIAQRLDMNEIASRLDVDALAARLDMNEIADGLDIDAIVARVDVEVLMDRLDMNAVAERLDLDLLMSRIDMAQLTAGATQDVATSGLDLARRQLVRADTTVDAGVARVLHRGADTRPAAPSDLRRRHGDLDERTPAPGGARRDVSGHFAGPVSRMLALGGDVMAAITSFGMVGSLLFYLLNIFAGFDTDVGSSGWLQETLLALWFLVWFWVPVSLFGRTPAMALVGLAVLARDGSAVTGRRALLRTLAMPFSLALLGLGLLGLVLGRERRTLHDVIGGTCVVYDWGERDAEVPASIRERLTARAQRRRAELPPPTPATSTSASTTSADSDPDADADADSE